MIDWWMVAADAMFPSDESADQFHAACEAFGVSVRRFRRGRISPFVVQVSRFGTFADCGDWITVVKGLAERSGGLFGGYCVELVESPRTVDDVQSVLERGTAG